MTTISILLVLAGLICLYMAKAALGNRDEGYMDAQVEASRSITEKEKNGRRATLYVLLGFLLCGAGISLSIFI
ncbi:hypothetical protein [Mechercharimyces sp. CAU 1602]|uniref:hypothetical protein n=1 Tax=Mechercharimyces sp. CAU 1602 TaxID=2973933 RepID=UPI002162BE2B|nr:hypothetical protein [Mechercharimyces sp. CAU 1602]MCS1350828.1 hypothetical protein [Mechercharimyces sp. CAU 1602]